MQITRERVVGEIAKLDAQRAQHLAQIEQIAANVNAVDGALIQCRAMLAVLDTPEPETDEQRESRMAPLAKPPSYCTTDGEKWCNEIVAMGRCADCPVEELARTQRFKRTGPPPQWTAEGPAPLDLPKVYETRDEVIARLAAKAPDAIPPEMLPVVPLADDEPWSCHCGADESHPHSAHCPYG